MEISAEAARKVWMELSKGTKGFNTFKKGQANVVLKFRAL